MSPRAVESPEHTASTTFEEVYAAQHVRLFGYVNRLCGEPDLAADIVQDAFIRLHQRGDLPTAPAAWLVTVATNLVRNAVTRSARRHQLAKAAMLSSDAADSPDAAASAEEREKVRATLDRLAPRERELLSLLAGGYRYREIAEALGIHEASVGTLLARAKQAFRDHYTADANDTP